MPKVGKSIKAPYVSMYESKKRTAMLRAKREFLEKTFSSDFFRKSDEDLKMIGVSSIDSLFSKIKIDEKVTEEESTLARRRPDNSEGHYSRLLLTRHYNQRPFDETVCDAIITNGGVK